jgi:hypothetical protein
VAKFEYLRTTATNGKSHSWIISIQTIFEEFLLLSSSEFCPSDSHLKTEDLFYLLFYSGVELGLSAQGKNRLRMKEDV